VSPIFSPLVTCWNSHHGKGTQASACWLLIEWPSLDECPASSLPAHSLLQGFRSLLSPPPWVDLRLWLLSAPLSFQLRSPHLSSDPTGCFLHTLVYRYASTV